MKDIENSRISTGFSPSTAVAKRMEDGDIHLRNSAKALIQKGDFFLVIENEDEHGSWFVLPGGGLEPGLESITQALVRKCREELGVEVIVGDLRHVREYISTEHEFMMEITRGVHHVDFIFSCSIPAAYDLASAPKGGYRRQLGARWMRPDELRDIRFYPRSLLDVLESADDTPRPVYLGAVRS